MANRDDFYKLDEYSFGKCLKILEEYNDVRFQIDGLLTSINPDKIELSTLDALDGMFEHFGKNDAVKLRRSIIAQIKKEVSEVD